LPHVRFNKFVALCLLRGLTRFASIEMIPFFIDFLLRSNGDMG
jgi:hypothetical protein